MAKGKQIKGQEEFDLQNTSQKTKDETTQTILKTRGELNLFSLK